MKRLTVSALCSTAVLALLSGCATVGGSAGARADLDARSGSQVRGVVYFSQAGEKLKVEATVSGLTPGEHGFHVHDVGDCSAADATSAKGHFNPAGKAHGQHAGEHHAGDMPNLVADAYGEAKLVAELDGVTLTGPSGVLGRSVIIHADPDDYKSQPAGNSGKRVACGVIK